MLDVMRRKSVRSILPTLALVAAVFGGIFLGLFSCGGTIWHRQLIYFLLSATVALALFVPPNWLATRGRRVLFAVAMGSLFILVRSVSSTFYPASPNSVGEFATSFIRALWSSLC